jgi:holo-[acyl-carrier protein] synthase
MIRGVGIDLVEIERLQHALERHGDRFARRILAEQEWSEFSELKPTLQARFLAKRFSVKEAFSKALGTGLGRGFGFQDISLGHDRLGKPILFWSERVSQVVDMTALQAHVSVTDERTHAASVVVLERDPSSNG